MPVKKAPTKKKAPVKKAAPTKAVEEKVDTPIDTAEADNSKGTEAIAGTPFRELSEEAPVQMLTLVTVALKSGGTINFDYPGVISNAREALKNLEDIVPEQLYIANPHTEVTFLQIEHVTAEEFQQRLAQQNSPVEA